MIIRVHRIIFDRVPSLDGILRRKPLTKTINPRSGKVTLSIAPFTLSRSTRVERTKMPFTKMTSRIALSFKNFCKCNFFFAHMPLIGRPNTIAIGMTTRDATAPGRRTNRGARIKPFEAQTIFRHRIKVGRFNDFIAIEPWVPPA